VNVPVVMALSETRHQPQRRSQPCRSFFAALQFPSVTAWLLPHFMPGSQRTCFPGRCGSGRALSVGQWRSWRLGRGLAPLSATTGRRRRKLLNGAPEGSNPWRCNGMARLPRGVDTAAWRGLRRKAAAAAIDRGRTRRHQSTTPCQRMQATEGSSVAHTVAVATGRLQRAGSCPVGSLHPSAQSCAAGKGAFWPRLRASPTSKDLDSLSRHLLQRTTKPLSEY